MKRLKKYRFTGMFFIFCFILMCNPGLADDTCMFTVTADDVPPNIVILLDNGAEMEQIIWHAGYDNSIDYTPNVTTESDIVSNRESGNGFFNNNGYTLVKDGNDYELVSIQDDLTPQTKNTGLNEDFVTTSTFTVNGKTVTLPHTPSTSEVDGVIDNATIFRYSKNYLNWIFFSGNYTGDGSDLPNTSRFYFAKKALMMVAKLSSNKASFGIYNFTSSADGGSKVQPPGMVVNTPLATLPEDNSLDPNFVNNINNMGTVTYSPLAEGLAYVGGEIASPSLHVVGEYCQKSFIIVVSPGVSSEDQSPAAGSSPASLSDYDGDNPAIGEGNIKVDTSSTYTIPVNQNGSTYLDDVAYYLYTNDIVGYEEGFQNVMTYTVGFMGDYLSNLFLINTSNNGNGNVNLYDTSDSEYGEYHFTAESPDNLSSKLLAAVNDILSRTSAFTAPVVPVTRTTSGNRIYMAFFKPSEENFWEGNVTKFGLNEDNVIVDKNNAAATWSNGALKDEAEPYWETKDWSDSSKSNYILYSNRNIYTYLGSSTDLTATSNGFTSANLTSALLGNPTHTPEQVINYVRGADVLDEDDDGSTAENREIITGDVLHSEPLVVRYNSSTAMVYFGANDGMLHAVNDSDGTEAWAFIPPDCLHGLKDIIEGSGHQYFVDSSPKVYINDANGDDVIDPNINGTTDTNGDGDINFKDRDRVILVCGERKGGTSYFALDVTDPFAPEFLWRINQSDDSATFGIPAPLVIPELGETWAEPRFGLVKTPKPEMPMLIQPVFFIGGGNSSDNSVGKAVVAINVLDGAVVKKFTTGMDYSVASSVTVVDADSNGFVDKVYVGDLGSQIWRFGKFTDSNGDPLSFPASDENINNWTGQIIFLADSAHERKFFYAPSVTLEKGYDLVFMGTGDREDPCSTTSSDGIYCVKDTHASSTLQESDLADVTDPTAAPPDLNVHQGWYIQLEAGEKVLAETTVFYKTLYLTTYTPNDDPCLPGGLGKLYALNYKTGGAVLDFDNDGNSERGLEIGGGIPSKVVVVISETKQKIYISVGSTNPDDLAQDVGAGVVALDPLAPPINFFYLWWSDFL